MWAELGNHDIASSISLASHPCRLRKEHPDAFSFQHDVMWNEKAWGACCSQTRQMISSPSWAFPGFSVQKGINKTCKVQFTGGCFSRSPLLAKSWSSSHSCLAAREREVTLNIAWPLPSAKWNGFSLRNWDIQGAKYILASATGDKLWVTNWGWWESLKHKVSKVFHWLQKPEIVLGIVSKV